MEHVPDPFREARAKDGVLRCPFQGETLPMILRHADVREAAKDWQKFSSDAPFRVPIPSEEAVRSMRQLPIETNPPEHGEYRALVEPFFQRAKQPEVIAKVEALIDELLTTALARESLEVVSEFALPAQSRALTYLLNVPEREADVNRSKSSASSRCPRSPARLRICSTCPNARRTCGSAGASMSSR